MNITGKYSEFINYESLAVALKDYEFRNNIGQDLVEKSINDLASATILLQDVKERNSAPDHILSTIRWIMECLRNSCICCERNQLMILSQERALEATLDIIQLDGFLQDQIKELTRIKKCALQFIGNLAVGNKVSQEYVWKRIFPQLTLTLIKTLDSSLKEILCMIIFNCVRERPDVYESDGFGRLLVSLIDHCQTHNSEWGLLILRNLAESGQFANAYNMLIDNHKQRMVLLDFFEACLDDEEIIIPEMTLDFVSSLFKKSLSEVMETSQKENIQQLQDMAFHLEAFAASKSVIPIVPFHMEELTILDEEVITMEAIFESLKILCIATSHVKYNSIRADEDLFDCAAFHLIEISKYSRKSGNKADEITTHHAYPDAIIRVKRDLVRLIGNLCYKNKRHQDRIREMDGISALLDNCQIDEQNPYIGQWAVFAIRNLCENNLENQNKILQLERQGIANYTDLEKMGIDVKIEDGKIKVKSQHPEK